MIGVFDSGVGGLSVLRQIRQRLPDADLLYVADRGRAPYGTRTLSEVSEIAHEVTNWLVERGASCVVVACNTASAASLHSIRDRHPGLPVVGMEPAVKPAARGTTSGTVAVYATAATFQGELYESVVSRFASGIDVMKRACPEWVELVEQGMVDGPPVEDLVGPVVAEAVDAGADRIVLACTHFSFLAPVIERMSGIDVIDPAPAVAAQTSRVAPDTTSRGETTLAASGNAKEFADLAFKLADFDQPVIRFAT